MAVGYKINLLTNSNGVTADSATSFGTLTEKFSLDCGSTRNIAGSLIARLIKKSFRAGKAKTDFASSNLDSTGAFGTVTYNTSVAILAGHLKLGKAFRLYRNNLLDV